MQKKILLGVEEATHFLGYLKRAGQPIAPRIVLFLFSLSICVAYFFFALEIQLKRKSSVLLATALSDQGLSVVSVASDATQPQTCEKKLL